MQPYMRVVSVVYSLSTGLSRVIIIVCVCPSVERYYNMVRRLSIDFPLIRFPSPESISPPAHLYFLHVALFRDLVAANACKRRVTVDGRSQSALGWNWVGGWSGWSGVSHCVQCSAYAYLTDSDFLYPLSSVYA
jgi:hypothetical protein